MGCESLHHNCRVTRNNIGDRSHRGYFMGCAATTVVILYWNSDQPFSIHRAHNDWFDESKCSLSIEYKHINSYLLLQQDPESLSM